VREKLDGVLTDETSAASLMRDHLTARLARLDQQEENLLDLATDGSLPREKLRQRLQNVLKERESVQRELSRATTDLQTGAQVIRDALAMVEDIPEMYRQSGDQGRRAINQTFFERVYVDEHGAVQEERLKPPFDEVLYLRARRPRAGHYMRRGGTTVGTASSLAPAAGLLEVALSGSDSSKTALVELRGFEPLTFSLRTRRATNCATAPWCDRNPNTSPTPF